MALVETLFSHAVVASAAGAFGWVLRNYNRLYGTSGVRRILADFQGSTVIVVPPRHGGPGAHLSNVSFADLMAVSNVARAVDAAGLRMRPKLIDSDHVKLADLNNKNVILICSPKSNKITDEAFRKINPISLGLPYFEIYGPAADMIKIVDPESGDFISPSYAQQATGSKEIDDYGLLLKARNPWNDHYSLLIIAGCRGIGTWGVAEYLRKRPTSRTADWARKERRHKKEMGRERTFAAVFRVHYAEGDIHERKTRVAFRVPRL